MKSNLCTLCKKTSNIKINVLNYCKECFIKQFESKIQKTLRNIPYKSKVLIIYTNKVWDIVFLNLLANLKNNKLLKFYFFNASNIKSDDIQNNYQFIEKYTTNPQNRCNTANVFDKSILKDCLEFLEDFQIVPNTLKNDIVEVILEGKIDIILYCKSLENICIDIFNKISCGVSIDKRDVNDFSIRDLCLFINTFKFIKNKEIQYMAYLDNIKYHNETVKNIKETKRSSIARFVKEMDKNNPLASFNVINTVNKINKKFE